MPTFQAKVRNTVSKPRRDIYNTLIESGLIPVFFTADGEHAQAYVQACLDGGVRAFEFTHRGPQALAVFQMLRQRFPDITLGIGSMVDAPTAALYLANGADFVVSPVFDLAMAELCNLRKVAYMPGCGSVTEVQAAHRCGVEIVKLFPADHYGPGFIKAIQAPMPWTSVMPTGGIDATVESIRPWFVAGACCVGIGSALAKVEDTAQTCRQLLTWIQDHRGGANHD
jgi:2-dehydro-3-deoxyphosphogluconate aldolase / (4S)-4-hydroxy-2-oxoglutarate aldolase